MSGQAWMTDVFGYLFGPISQEEFFRDYHEKKALICKREDSERYIDLLSIERIDEIVSTLDFEVGQLEMTRADPPVNRTDYSFENGRIDKGAVARQFQQGATLILPQLHMNDPRLADFCRALETRLSCHVQTNIYLTPPDAQGFKTHYDDHDVFVLQVSGSKSWRLYNTPIENPYRGENFQPDIHEAGDPVEEFVLEAGDCAYVPRGLMHDALTHGDESSLHITVGLIVKTWADLMLEVISQVALDHPGFRRSLPAGFATSEFDRASVEPVFRELVDAISTNANLDDAMDIYVDNFIRSRTPPTSGTIVNFQSALAPGLSYKLRDNLPWRFAGDGDDVVLITAGGEVRFPAAAESGIERLLDGETITAESFDGIDEEARTQALKRLYAFGIIEPVS